MCAQQVLNMAALLLPMPVTEAVSAERACAACVLQRLAKRASFGKS